jgi:hypothetical protein
MQERVKGARTVKTGIFPQISFLLLISFQIPKSARFFATFPYLSIMAGTRRALMPRADEILPPLVINFNDELANSEECSPKKEFGNTSVKKLRDFLNPPMPIGAKPG